MVMNGNQKLCDKDIAADALNSQRRATDSYNTFLGEINCPDVRQPFMNLLQEEHQLENQIFDLMNQKGWYPVIQADQQQIQQAKQQFTQMQNKL